MIKLQKWEDERQVPPNAIAVYTCLEAVHFDKDGNFVQKRVVRNRSVTTAFVYEIVDVLQGTSGDFDQYKWHHSGKSTVAESTAQTSLLGSTGNPFAGTQAEGGSSNIYQSVATCTYGASAAITEHGLFNASDAAAGTMMDRTLFAAVNVNSGDKIQFTFSITFTPGG